MRKLLGSLMVLAAVAFAFFAAHAQSKSDPPPVLTDKAHADIRDTEFALVQAQAQMEQIKQQYAALQKQAGDLQVKLQAELKENEKAGYTLNPQTLEYVKAPPDKNPK